MCMSLFRHSLCLLFAVSLSSCVQQLPPLASGNRISFVNRMAPEVLIATKGLLPLDLDSKRLTVPLPAGRAMMRRVVMEEAAKAGVRVDYSEVDIKTIGSSSREAKAATQAAMTSTATASVYMTPHPLMGPYNSIIEGGFTVTISKFKGAGPGVTMQLVSRLDRYQKVEGEVRSSLFPSGLERRYGGLGSTNRWDTASAESQAKAMAVFEELFRVQIAGLFGNLPPKMLSNSETEKLTL
jgi:hypothetical protein